MSLTFLLSKCAHTEIKHFLENNFIVDNSCFNFAVLVPKPNALTDRIRKLPQLHNGDEAKKLKLLGDSDFVLV